MYLSRVTYLPRIVSVVFATVLSMSAASAAVFNVSAQADFQNALTTAATNGEADTINVSAGTVNLTATLTYAPGFSENFALTIQGAGPGMTILDGGNVRRALSLDTRSAVPDTNAALSVAGITFQNGNNAGAVEPDGGGVFLQTGTASITLRDCQVLNSVADDDGGGLSASIDNGIDSFILVEDSMFNDNIAVGTSATGGDGEGGGTKLDGNGATVTLKDNTFNRNQAEDDGAGALIDDADSASVSGNTFADNIASPDGEGGGLEVRVDELADLRDNIFLRNRAFDGGGAVLDDFTDAVVVNNVFLNNEAEIFVVGDGDGGGLDIEADCFCNSIVVTNNTFYGNSGDEGGGLRVEALTGMQVDISNNIVWGNFSSFTPQGADIYADDDDDGDGIGGSVNLGFNDFGFFLSDCESQASACQPDVNLGNNVNVDPMLRDPANGDAHLQAGSQVIDKGNNTAPSIPERDFEGDKRIQDGNRDRNVVVDMGADEVPGRFFPIAIIILLEEEEE